MQKIVWALILLPLFSIAQKPKLVIRSGHANAMHEPVYSPDGKYIITVSDDGTAKVWEAATGNLINTYNGGGGRVYKAWLSPDNAEISVFDLDEYKIHVWDTKTGLRIAKKQYFENMFGKIAYGLLTYRENKGKIYIFNTENYQQILLAEKFRSFYLDTTKSVLYTLVDNGNTGLIRSYSFPSGKPIASGKPFELKEGMILSGVKSTLALSVEGNVHIINSALSITKTIPVTKGRITGMWFKKNDSSMLIFRTSDQFVKVLNTANGKTLLNVKSGNPGRIDLDMAFSPNNKYFIVDLEDYDSKYRIYDLRNGKEALQFYPTDSLQYSSDEKYARNIEMVVFTPAKKTMTVLYTKGMIKEFGLKNDLLLNEKNFNTETEGLVYNPSGQELIAYNGTNSSGNVSVLSGLTLEKKFDLFKEERGITDYFFDTANNRILFGRDADDNLNVFDLKTSTTRSFITPPRQYYQSYEHTLETIIANPQKNIIITLHSDRHIAIWDAKTLELVKIFLSDGDIITAHAVSNDGKFLAVGSRSSVIRIFDLDSFTIVRQFGKEKAQQADGLQDEDFEALQAKSEAGAPSHWSSGLVFSKDGRYLASDNYGIREPNIIVYDLFQNDHFTLNTEHNAYRDLSFNNKTDELLVQDYLRLSIVDPDKKTVSYQLHGRNTTPLFDSSNGKVVRTRISDMNAAFLKNGNGLFMFDQDTITIRDNNYHIAITRSLKNEYAVYDTASGYIFTFSGERINAVIDPLTLQNVCDNGSCFDKYLRFSNLSVRTGSSNQEIALCKNNQVIASFYNFSNDSWVVIDSVGRFDATPKALEKLNFTTATNDKQTIATTIELNQLKSRYYQPGLLPVLLGFSNEPLRAVPAFNKIDPAPTADLAINGNILNIRLKDMNGGIGKVSVFIDNNELFEDATTEAGNTKQNITIDLSKYRSLIDQNAANTIKVITNNGGNWISSPPYLISYIPASAKGVTITPQPKKKELKKFYAVVAGISDYAGTALDLNYAAKDAQDFAQAASMAAANLFQKENTQVYLLHSGEKTDSLKPTKTNFKRILQHLANVMQPQDVLLVYLSGHGVNYGGQDGDFYYLTAEASAAEAAYLKDPQMREAVTISSNELTAMLKMIAARKKVLILDACASGKAAEMMSIAMRDVPASQVRALDRMADRTGFYVLSGSAADAVSYEAGMYGQGLLTYALLKGMRGAALRQDGNEEYADVQTLLEYAVDEVPKLAAGIGGIQQPLYRNPGDQETYDIGRMDDASKKAIVIAEPKPVFMPTAFINIDENEDDLMLGKYINAAFREITAKGKDATLWFTEAKDYPGAWKLSGNYKIVGNTITLSYRLRRNEDKYDNTITGDKNDLAALTKNLLAAVTAQVERSNK